MPNVISRSPDGSYTAREPFVVTCGCGGVVPDARNKLRMAGVPHVPMLVSSDNRIVRDYVRVVGLTNHVPKLLKNKHAVLFNPTTGKYIDLLNVAKTKELYARIYEVVNGV